MPRKRYECDGCLKEFKGQPVVRLSSSDRYRDFHSVDCYRAYRELMADIDAWLGEFA